MKSDIATVDSRLARLERANKLLLLTGACALLLAAARTAQQPEVVRAGSIQLLDPAGHVVAELAIRDDKPGLYLTDDNGKTRVALFHADDATGLYINDQDEVTRVGIAQFAHGGGGVALHGPESRGAAVLYFKDSGSLRFFDAAGKVTNAIAATPQVPPH